MNIENNKEEVFIGGASVDNMIIVFIFIIGLCIGSFLNVVGLRVPKKESIVFPGSHCTKCEHKLKAYELIPFFSYIFLRGKCRKCKEKISFEYPLFELLTGLVFVFLFMNTTNIVQFIFYALLMSVMIALTISDLEYRIVPNKILIYAFSVLVPLGVYVGIFIEQNSYLSHLLGGVIFFVSLLLLAVITKGGMGGGDIKLLSLIGLALGLKKTFLIFFIACTVGAVIGIIVKMFKKDSSVVPFVPFICVGVLIVLIYTEPIWNLLFNR